MVLGVTGGIGAGKSLVCQIFSGLGVPIYNSDQRAKVLMQEHEGLRGQIKAHFGSEAYLDGNLNRAHLAEQVFSDESQLKLLNSLVHPAVGADFIEWKRNSSSLAPYLIKEAAILIESGAHKTVDTICVVSAPESVRIDRVVQRDQVDADAVKARMANQMTDETRVGSELCNAATSRP